MKPHGENGFELIGPGMRSTHENPLLGVSSGACRIQGPTLELAVEFGGARMMQWFLLCFPIGLGILLALVFSFTIGGWTAITTPQLAVAPWLVLSPLMSRWIYKRTESTVETAMQNAAEN